MGEGEVALTQPERVLLAACVQWASDSIGEGFCVPEEAFWAYSSASGDNDWETLPDRIAARLGITLQKEPTP